METGGAYYVWGSVCLPAQRISELEAAVFTKMTGQFYSLKAALGALACLWSKFLHLGAISYQKTYLPVILVKTALVDNASYPDGAGNNPAIFALIDTNHP